MADTVIMPKLGFDMAEGTLVRWVASEGEQIKKGAVLAEIETDKATVEVESSFEGTLLRHLVAQGAVVPVGDPIAVVGKPGEKVEVPLVEKVMPVKQAQTIPPAVKEEKPVTTQPARAVPEAPAIEVEEGHLPEGLRASPVARRIAEEHGINLKQVRGSGPGGRITKKDLDSFVPTMIPAAPVAEPIPTPAPAVVAFPAPLPVWQPVGSSPADEVIPLSRLRAAVGRRMVQAKQQVPHFYVTHEYDVGELIELRAKVNQMLTEGEKLSVNDFILKAVALTLRQFPNLNATLDGDKVIRRGQINLGSAVSVEGGLLTVVCREADRKPIRQISLELRAMAERARQGKVHPEDVDGSTFSVSNMGMYEVENFIAIINPPEAAILAVGTAREVPVIVDGQVKPGMRMKATISVDHRVSDGAEAARFMQALAVYLEEPLKLLL
jgi:pyruvate dehydrogenase E2 component (dihydrolipoamide acetyltransferase)